MKSLFVFADFNWMDAPMLVGELGYESLRGSDSYAFRFDEKWLAKFGSLFLCADINNYPGPQYTQPDKDIFGCFSDALPDRWGRLLLNRREQIIAAEENRPVRRLSSFDYLVGIDDFSRMGGLRFKESLDGAFINCDDSLRIPPFTSIHTLVAASMEIEKSEAQNQLPEFSSCSILAPHLVGRDPRQAFWMLMAGFVWQSFLHGTTPTMWLCGNTIVICWPKRRESSRPKRTCCLPVANTTSCYPKDSTGQRRAEDDTSHLL